MKKQFAISSNEFMYDRSAEASTPKMVFNSRRIGLYDQPSQLPAFNMNAVLLQLFQLKNEVSSSLIDMDTPVRLAILGLMTGDNVFLLSHPGAAKSTMASLIGQGIDGKFFRKNFTPGMSESDIFGPISLEDLNQGRYVRAWSGLATASYALLDEFFKADERTQHLLLEAMEEKQLSTADGQHSMPLLANIAASNELVNATPSNATWDRFGYRYEMPYAYSPKDYTRIGQSNGANAVITTKIDPDDIQMLQAFIEYKAKCLPKEVLAAIEKIMGGLVHDNIFPSARRYKVFLRAVYAEYLLKFAEAVFTKQDVSKFTTDTHTAMMKDSLEIGKYILWIEPSDRDKVIDKISRATDKVRQAVIDAKAKIEKIKSKKDGASQKKALGYIREMKDLSESLRKLMDEDSVQKTTKDIDTLNETIQEAETLRLELLAQSTEAATEKANEIFNI